MRPTTITLDFEPESSEATGEVYNEDRAAMVAPLIAGFEAAYYYLGEEDETIVKDIIQDLCHYLHRMDHPDDAINTADEEDRSTWVFDLLESAWAGYVEEMTIEREADEEANREEDDDD